MPARWKPRDEEDAFNARGEHVGDREGQMKSEAAVLLQAKRCMHALTLNVILPLNLATFGHIPQTQFPPVYNMRLIDMTATSCCLIYFNF